MKKKILSAAMALAIALSLLPTAVFATGVEATELVELSSIEADEETGTYDKDGMNSAHLQYEYYSDKFCYPVKGESPAEKSLQWVKSVTITGINFGQLNDDSMEPLQKIIMNGRRADTPAQFQDSIEVKFVNCTFNQTSTHLQVYKIKPCDVSKYTFENCTFNQQAAGEYAITLNASETNYDKRAISYEIIGSTINSEGRGINITAGTETQTLGNNLPSIIIDNNTFNLPATGESNMAIQIAGNWDSANLGAGDDPLITISNNEIKSAYTAIRVHNTASESSKYVVGLTGNTIPDSTTPVIADGDGETAQKIADYYSAVWKGDFAAEIGEKKYVTLADAITAASEGATITLLQDTEIGAATISTENLVLDGDGHTITSTATSGENAITITADGVTLQDVTIQAGAAKYGVQFYVAESGKLDGVTIDGGTYASVLVNGSEVTLTDVVTKPTGYANIEYAMGGGVTEKPTIALENVSGTADTPLVYVDQGTADKFKGDDASKPYEAIAAEINETHLTGAQVTIVIMKDDGQFDEENSVPGTFTYTVTFNANDGVASASTMTTNNEGKLETLPTATRSGYEFQGWFWNGTQVTTGTVFTSDATVSASWSIQNTGGGGGGGSSSYSISVDKDIDNGSVTVSPKSASSGRTVTITVKPDEGYELDGLTVTDKNGDEIKLTDKGDGKYTFTMPRSKVTIVASFVEENDPDTPVFADVSSDAYYYEAVLWAVEKGITSGTSDNTFSPDASCTRGQIVTFLWRAAGSPRASGANPFTDVSADAYYYDAVLWAVNQGITSGTSETTFSPDATVTRGQTVTFLWRANGSPAASGSGFIDVADSAYYADAVTWAAGSGVTSGTGNGMFSPDAPCTRAQIVTFLFRDMVK